MGPKPAAPETDELFIFRLEKLINMRPPLMRLTGLIDWADIERTIGAHFSSDRGRPALARLVACRLYLQQAFDVLDEAVVNT